VPFVLDASSALPWCFRDEATAETDALLYRATDGERIYVPAHWPAEMLSGLTRAARRGRVDDPGVDRFLSLFPVYNIVVDAGEFQSRWNDALPLVRLHRLSGYDAMYLALAKRLNIGLATFDGRLRDAAIAERVPLVI
jgi:predicted nucleic acid-binding protein